MTDTYDTNKDVSSSDTLLASMKTTLKRLLKFWWLFLITGIITGISGVIYSTFQKTQYQSRATFALDDVDGSGIGNLINLASQFGLNIGGGKNVFAGDNILEILKSRRLIEQVLTSADTLDNKPYTLIQYYIDQSGQPQNKKKQPALFLPGTDRENYTSKQDSILYKYYKLFSKNLIIADRPDKKLGIYEVKVKTPNERLSKVFTDKLLESANILYTNIRTKKTKQTLEILEKRAEITKGNLDKSISERASIQDVNVNPAFEKATVPVIKQQSNIQVYGAAYGELLKSLEIARFQYLNEIPIMQIIDQPEYPMEIVKISKLKSAVIFIFLGELLVLFVLGIKYIFED